MAKRDKITMRQIFEMQCDICKAMAHPARMQIVERLSRGETAAATLLLALGTSKANLSKHMTILTQAGIVEQRKAGRSVHYSLVYPEIHEACSIMRSILYRQLKRGVKIATAMKRPQFR